MFGDEPESVDAVPDDSPPAAEPSSADCCVELPVDDFDVGWAELTPGCLPRVGWDDDPVEAEDASDELDPVDPGDPLGSANAIGIATTAEPTPRATASAPTRPTYRAGSLCAGGFKPIRRSSMGCTAVTARRRRPPTVEPGFVVWVCFTTGASSQLFMGPSRE